MWEPERARTVEENNQCLSTDNDKVPEDPPAPYHSTTDLRMQRTIPRASRFYDACTSDKASVFKCVSSQRGC